ncbi:hypothetical protein [Streptomyces sp. NPDC001404]|uniref:hypothetical protein n=1 Tax=Streptomyces sp. NPDC001404 TaxID=3364571 RepID=UPI0036871B5A
MSTTTELVRDAAQNDSGDYYADGSDAGRYRTPDLMLSDKMQTLVKGAGYAKPGGNTPLGDDDKIFRQSMRAETAFRNSIKQGIESPQQVLKSLSPDFAGRFGAFLAATPQNQMMSQWVGQLSQQVSEAVGKSISLTSPLSTSFAPFNLLAPSRLIFPVYSPLRNKIARTPGQGTYYREKVITGVTGSQTGASGGKFTRISIPEFQGGGSFSNWPLNLPASGTQDAVDIVVPYKFAGMSENLSWLAQFSGQGFEDVSALANLILLQEFMLNEEASFLASTSIALSTPSAPAVTARTANTGETALSGVTTNVYVKVTANTWYGETAASAGASVAWSSGQVVDVAITPVAGAQWYNLYVTTGASAGTYYLMKSQVGGAYFTLQGALPASGTAAPSSDSGTSSSNDYEGIISTLAGHSAGSSAVYPAGWQGGYVNQAVGDTLNHNVLNTALQQLWDGSGAFRADPAELIAEGGDVMRMSNDIVNSSSNNGAYRLFVEQSEVPGVRLGAAVSEFQNPVTRNVVRVVVHPWLTQGTALLMSYQLPFAWSNVSNVWEYNVVQDYLSISWPVIDATFRYSMYTFGAMIANAPQYCGLLQGIQQTDRSGTTGTWS